MPDAARRKTLLKAAQQFGTPLYAYEAEVIRSQCRALRAAFPNTAIHYAMKANSNPALLSIVRNEGIGIEAVSPGEIRAAQKTGFTRKEISFTCASLATPELAFAAKHAGVVHLDSLVQLEIWGRKKLGKNVSLRVNQGIGSGHHHHTITGGPDSKFGIETADFAKAHAIVKRYGLTIISLQQHIGSGILSADVFMEGVEALLDATEKFETVTHLDFGGGLGIPYRPGEKAWNLNALGKRFHARMAAFEKEKGTAFSYGFEPGRYIVAQSGTLLATVVDDKKTATHRFIGIDTGFNHLIRPAMYGSYHHIENLSRTGGKKESITIAGNVCESGDLFALDRVMPLPKLGDVIAIRDAGAYGMSMASASYNLRALPREVLIEGNRLKSI